MAQGKKERLGIKALQVPVEGGPRTGVENFLLMNAHLDDVIVLKVVLYGFDIFGVQLKKSSSWR